MSAPFVLPSLRAPSPKPSPVRSTAAFVDPPALACPLPPMTPPSKCKSSKPPSPARSEASVASTLDSPARSTVSSVSSPQKLRHPSRMSRKQVTEGIFRDYMRHYIMHGPPPTMDDDGYDSPTPAPSKVSATPKKASRFAPTDETPRPVKRKRNGSPPHTPTSRSRNRHHDADATDSMHGFTLSHLRRVPELALLADKLYRRELDNRRKAGKSPPTERPAIKKKRLFERHVNELLRGSTIVLWEGPVHPTPDPSLQYTDTLWRMHSNRSQTQPSNMSGASTATVASQLDVSDLIADLSDPPSEEDSYVPLKTEYLAHHVSSALKRLTDPVVDKPRLPGLRQYRKPGMTAQRITQALKSADERWKEISEWNVREALKFLEEQGSAWQSSTQEGGRWELTE